MSALRTRPPTGEMAWPLVLVEGAEKTGKSFAALSLSADERVGRTFVIDLGEGTADEYAELGPYEVIEHNGSYVDILDQIKAACAVPIEDGKPNVVVFDSVTPLWDVLKDWVDGRARNTRAGKRKLAEDPDAEIDISMNLWNDAKDRWYRIINLLRRSDVVGVLIARAKEVAKVQGGQPVAGQTDYKVEAEKGTAYAVTAQVRMSHPHTATLVAVRKLGLELPPRGLELPGGNPVGHLVFDVLGCGAGTGPARITHGVVGVSVLDAKNQLVDFLRNASDPDPIDSAKRVWASHGTQADELTPTQVEKLMDEAMNHVARESARDAARSMSPPSEQAEQGVLT